jgi:hypothetical protein
MSTFSSLGEIPLLLAYGVIFFVVTGIAYIAMCLVNGVALWYAARMLRMPPLPFGPAFHASWLANMPVWVCSVGIFVVLLFRVALDGRGTMADRALSEILSPTLLFFGWVAAVLAQATIYVQVCRNEDGEPLRFGQAAALSLVALSLDGLVFVPITSLFLFAMMLYL